MISLLQRRILDISFRRGLSHIGSCISCVDIIDDIYSRKAPDEPFCMGNAHAGLALYVVLEKWFGFNAEAILDKHGIHATRDSDFHIDVSGGSLGQVETVACGMALADRTKKVYLLSSDGSMQEGACWESLWIKRDLKLDNLSWAINANGYAAYREMDTIELETAIDAICPDVRVVHTTFAGIPFLNGIDAHYRVMKPEDWAWVEQETASYVGMSCPECLGEGQKMTRAAGARTHHLVPCKRCQETGRLS